MSSEMIAIAADHAGYELKNLLKQRLIEDGFDVVDLGTDNSESVDYPDFARALAKEITDGRSAKGILLCGSGIGMSIAANRFPGVRAALVNDEEGARLARQHNDANVLVLGARRIEQSIAEDCLKAFTTTPFEGGRHQWRVQKMA
jgi:ribose 5-phosphate isomerase B